MRPSRRQLLIAIGTGALVSVAGCLGDDDDEDIDLGEEVVGVSVTPDQPTLDDLSADVSVVHGFMDARPARIETTLTNEGDEEITIHGAMYGGFAIDDLHTGRDGGGERLVAIPLSGMDDHDPLVADPDDPEHEDEIGLPDDHDDGCWSLGGYTPFDGERRSSETADPVTIDPGDAVEETFELYYAHVFDFSPEGGSCPGPGRYPFVTDISADGSTVFWGFEVTVE